MRVEGNGFTIVVAHRGIELPDPNAPTLRQRRPDLLPPVLPSAFRQADCSSSGRREVDPTPASVSIPAPRRLMPTRRPAAAAVDCARGTARGQAASSSMAAGSLTAPTVPAMPDALPAVPCVVCGVAVAAAYVTRTGQARHGCCTTSTVEVGPELEAAAR